MSQPVFGPAALAWKISEYPQYWIPLILIFAAGILGIYFLASSTVTDPLPNPSEVKEMYISWKPSAGDSSFKKINHEQYYPEIYDIMGQGFASTQDPGTDVAAAVRLVSNDCRTTVIEFFDSELVNIGGQCYDRAMPYMALQMLEGTMYDQGGR